MARPFNDVQRLGVVVGKFNPPHLGHVHLIEAAALRVEQVVVLLCDRPDQTIDATDRARWLADATPATVDIVITPDDLPTANEPWAERALELLPRPPDLAFTSEPWGSGWAELMGATHVPVDLERSVVPISATELRRDLGASFSWLVPAARADLSRRVVLAGAESAGKTTLAAQLAQSFGTVWVPEVGRSYWEGRRHLVDQSWTSDEFRRIAVAQQRLDHDLGRSAINGVVIGDTDGLVTAVWHERYLGHVDPVLDALAAEHVPDLYLVCAPDFGWVQDGTRESAEYRTLMHERTLERARASGAGVEVLHGPPSARLEEARRLVEPLTRFPTLV